MPSAKQKSTPAKHPARIQLWVRLTLPGLGLIGPGKIELLRRIQQHESISAAARAMRMSYRRAWLLVDELNGLFDRPVVMKWFGGKSRGGAKLTPTGEKLLRTYDAIVERSNRASRSLLNDLARSVRLRKR
jgi:molybdate transport system regulatory protein